MESVIKSYNVFVDSHQSTKRINLFEQAPTGGVVRVSLKQIQVHRTFGNVNTNYLRFRVKIDDESKPLTNEQAFIDTMTEIVLPDAHYADPTELFSLKAERIQTFVRQSYADAVVQFYINDNDTVTWVIAGSFISDSKSVYLKEYDIPTMEFSAATNDIEQPIVYERFGKYFYLRIDGATGNLESKELSAQGVDPSNDELIQSDILGAIPFTPGTAPYSYHARVKNESSFTNHTSVQAIELRLTDQQNNPIQSDGGMAISWSAVLQVELVVNQSIQPAGYGQTPTRVDPKLTGNIYRPI
eukprot:scaffold33911_cov32-Tisochrysis_lutea.AAC.1